MSPKYAASLDDEINRIQNRIGSAVNDKPVGEESKYYKDYLKQLNDDLNNLKKQRNEIAELKHNTALNPVSLKLIRESLKLFVTNIKLYPPDQQYLLLKEYVTQISYDRISECYKLLLVIKDPQNSSENKKHLLEKVLYIPSE